jgi:hypothetical protein
MCRACLRPLHPPGMQLVPRDKRVPGLEPELADDDAGDGERTRATSSGGRPSKALIRMIGG